MATVAQCKTYVSAGCYKFVTYEEDRRRLEEDEGEDEGEGEGEGEDEGEGESGCMAWDEQHFEYVTAEEEFACPAGANCICAKTDRRLTARTLYPQIFILGGDSNLKAAVQAAIESNGFEKALQTAYGSAGVTVPGLKLQSKVYSAPAQSS